MNLYHRDSLMFLREAALKIDNTMTREQLVQVVINLALGLERLLKGILFDVNPLYVLMEPSFNNSIKVLYSSKLTVLGNNNKIPEKDKNADVISFKNSLMRAQMLSETVQKYNNILFAISEARDVIAHSDLDLLEDKRIETIVKKDFYPMMKDFANELGIPVVKYLNGANNKLVKIGISMQDNFFLRMDQLLEYHKSIWDEHKKQLGYVEKQQRLTIKILSSKERGSVSCPACTQTAIVYLRAVSEFDMFVGERMLIGHEPDGLRCKFCKLEINEPSALDLLGIRADNVTRHCINCETNLTARESGLCQECENL